MPWTCDFDRRLALVRAVFTGPCSMDDVADYLVALSEDDRFEPSMREIVDLRRATFRADRMDLMRTARIDPFGARSRRALLVPDDLHFGMVRQFDSARAAAPGGPRPVRSVKEAADHLELTVSELGLDDGDLA